MKSDDPLSAATNLPDLYKLFERHIGFYEPLCVAYADAASVCLDRHHSSPADFDIDADGTLRSRQLSWIVPSSLVKKSWNNSDDAIRDGAYSVALASIESELGYVALLRAERKTGADYYVGLPGSDPEDSYRLEVSGTEIEGSETERRLRAKLKQAKEGKSDLPAFACVIGFRVKKIAIGKLEAD